MAQSIIMPKFGQSTDEDVTIVKWHKHEGDTVKKGDVLFEVETEKAVLEAQSFYDGVMLKILVKDKESVPVSAVIAYIGEKGEKAPETAVALARKQDGSSSAGAPAGRDEPRKEAAAASSSKRVEESRPAARREASATPLLIAATNEPSRLLISPRARALAVKCVINPVNIRGTGPNGRILERDVKTYLAENNYEKLKISPAAGKLASENKIDVLTVKGTEDGGRIMVRDIEKAIAEKPKAMSKMRQVIAKRLTESFTTTPHFYATVSVDMTGLSAFRQELKARGESYTVTDFILEAVILSLKEFPAMNSVTDGTSLKWHSNVHLGLAVALENGLVVPPIRNAEELSIKELHDIARDLATRAREGKLSPDEMKGSTFTVSNMGMLDVENFFAIINPGEAAILAVASTIEKPVVINGKIEVRSIMKMTLSSDHRIADGNIAAAFVNAIKAKLQNLELWKRLV